MIREEIEGIKEFLTRKLGSKLIFTVHVPHKIYEIRDEGFLYYLGNDIWQIGCIKFPTDSVSLVMQTTLTIQLKDYSEEGAK